MKSNRWQGKDKAATSLVPWVEGSKGNSRGNREAGQSGKTLESGLQDFTLTRYTALGRDRTMVSSICFRKLVNALSHLRGKQSSWLCIPSNFPNVLVSVSQRFLSYNKMVSCYLFFSRVFSWGILPLFVGLKNKMITHKIWATADQFSMQDSCELKIKLEEKEIFV